MTAASHARIRLEESSWNASASVGVKNGSGFKVSTVSFLRAVMEHDTAKQFEDRLRDAESTVPLKLSF